MAKNLNRHCIRFQANKPARREQISNGRPRKTRILMGRKIKDFQEVKPNANTFEVLSLMRAQLPPFTYKKYKIQILASLSSDII